MLFRITSICDFISIEFEVFISSFESKLGGDVEIEDCIDKYELVFCEINLNIYKRAGAKASWK